MGKGYFTFSSLVTCLSLVSAVKFPKDQRMDMKFPADVTLPNSPGVPIGHLRPLGHHRRSNGEVKAISVDDMKALNPGLLRKQLPEVSIWPNASEITEQNDVDVKVTKRQAHGHSSIEVMKLSKFLEEAGSEEWLLNDVLSSEQLNTLQLPVQSLSCLIDDLLYVTSALTSGATSDDVKLSLTTNTLQCVTSGRRDFIVMRANNNVPVTADGGFKVLCDMVNVVDINPDLVNIYEKPWVSGLSWQHASLYKGDCLFIPAGYLYHSMSYARTETVSFTWHRRDKCSKVDEKNSQEKKISPLLCKENSKVTLCPDSDENEESRWRKLLISLVNKEDVLSRFCFNSLFEDKETASNVYGTLGDTPVNYKTLVSVSDDLMRNVVDLSKAKFKIDLPKGHQHSHDEL